MKPTQILPEPINRHITAKLLLIALFVIVTMSILHVREDREQWKEYHINMATGGYYD